jgi:hypothetical protein
MKWNQKWLPWILLIVMGLAWAYKSGVLGGKKQRNPETGPQRTQKQGPARPGHETPPYDPTHPGSDRSIGAFNRKPASLQFSKHARCRMGCRHIDGDEVNELLEKGAINPHKSDMRAQPDPRYAVEGVTRDGQQVRIIVAQSPRSSTIVTVIDTGNDWPCNCPGDEKKNRY